MLLLQAGQPHYLDQGMNKEECFPKQNLTAKPVMYFTIDKSELWLMFPMGTSLNHHSLLSVSQYPSKTGT